MGDHNQAPISDHAKRLPVHLVGEGIGQFLDRKTFNNLRLTCKDVYQITNQMVQPWPHTSLSVSKTSIQSIAFSPDGTKLTCRDMGGKIHVWDRSFGHDQTFHGSRRSACIGNIVCNDRFLAFDGKSKSIQVCSLKGGASRKVLHGHQGAITSMSFHADGRTMASSSTDNTVRLWDLGTGKCLRVIEKHRGFVYSVTFSKDGQLLASGGSDGIIRVWSPWFGPPPEAGNMILLRGHVLVVASLSFSPTNSNILASGSLDGILRLWDVSNQTCLRSWQYQGSEILTVCFSPSGLRLAVGISDETILLLDLKEGKEEAEFNGRLLSFAPDGVTLATAGRDGIVKLQSI